MLEKRHLCHLVLGGTDTAGSGGSIIGGGLELDAVMEIFTIRRCDPLTGVMSLTKSILIAPQ